ncbi:MAG: 6-bladed beta-propeller [Verrucomicrobiota bacterium]|nr:6-bladed beta-propeller [Verrucomicrobiota bacterium]
MKSLFTFLFTALFLIGCTDQHSHNHDHGHGEGEHHHAEGDHHGHDHDSMQESPTGVRMGTGMMTFDTVPGWGLTVEGKSAIGPTHGGVIVGKDGTIYTSADKGVIAFSPDGKVIREFVGEPYTKLHDIEIRDEGTTEYLYGARNNNAEGIKFNAADGKVALRLPFPKESKLELAKFSPTAITVSIDGRIFLSDGYASNIIFIFDKDGNYLKHFGAKGNGPRQFNTAHGMTLDARYDPPRLLICDRNHQPKGRLLHYSLEGEYINEVIGGLGMPTSVAVQGDYVSVPDLHGRVVILDKSNTIMAVLGHNPDPKLGRSYGVKQSDWIEGVFSGTHGSGWDAEGNLYVQDWNVDGRIMKLVRVKG